MKIVAIISVITSVFASIACAGEVADVQGRFTIVFPESDEWSVVEQSAPMAHTTYWSTTNETIGVILSMMMIDAPMPGRKPTFRENAEGWETGIMKKFSKKLSARFSSLSGVDAYEVVTTIEADSEVYYFSNWYVQVGDVSYCLTITSADRDQLSGEDAEAFLKSFRLQKEKKTANQALQTTPMTRSESEKTILFGRPQRGV